MCGEMGQLVEADQRDLGALPVIDCAVQLEMGKFDFAASWPAPFVGAVVRDATKPRIEVQALIPQSAGIGDLGRRAAEEHRSKPWHLADIAQRLQDPLGELVKIDPRSIGVGQYQHDLSEHKLSRSLDAVVEDCVNAVGVDANTASTPLLSRVSGIGEGLARSIVGYREEHGPFRCRTALKE